MYSLVKTANFGVWKIGRLFSYIHTNKNVFMQWDTQTLNINIIEYLH